MTDRTLTGLLRAALAVGGACAVTGSVIFFAVGQAGPWWSDMFGLLALVGAAVPVVAWVVVPHQARNAVVWTMALAGFSSGLLVAGTATAMLLVDDPDLIKEGDA